MIVSTNGKSYDSSDGSEQLHSASAEPRERSEREEINRWEDDGPGPHAHVTAAATDAPCKPAWSVLSLRNLLEAVRRLGRAEDAPQPARGNGAAARDGRPAEDSRQASAADAGRDPYRNHWENT